ncbi:hypothetical protein [Thioclava sp.]|uniref:hypothetical protein n=1 Tax=Thioclava sp. TaxID=1933450 RepID=UPI003241DFA7
MNDMTNTPGTGLMLPAGTDLAALFKDQAAVDPLIERIEKEVRAHVPDTSSAKGREAIKSLAYKVARSKTALDDAGKALNEEARAQINQVDAARRKIRDRLDALKDEARKPLTEWEEAEAARKTRDAQILEQLKNHGMTGHEPSAEIVATAGRIRDIALPEDFTGDRDAAEDTRATTMAALRNMFTAAQTREAEAAELERLRKEKAERDAADEAERIKRELEENARQAAERAQQEQQEAEARAAREAEEAKERATAQRRDLAARLTQHVRNAGKGMIDGQVYPFPMLIAEVRDRVMRDIEACGEFGEGVLVVRQKVLADLEAAYQEHQAEAREQAKAEAARREEEAAQRERDRIAAEKRAEEEAQRKREENARIRNRIKREITAALAALPQPLTPETVAETLVVGGIPNTTVRF